MGVIHRSRQVFLRLESLKSLPKEPTHLPSRHDYFALIDDHFELRRHLDELRKVGTWVAHRRHAITLISKFFSFSSGIFAFVKHVKQFTLSIFPIQKTFMGTSLYQKSQKREEGNMNRAQSHFPAIPSIAQDLADRTQQYRVIQKRLQQCSADGVICEVQLYV